MHIKICAIYREGILNGQNAVCKVLCYKIITEQCSKVEETSYSWLRPSLLL